MNVCSNEHSRQRLGGLYGIPISLQYTNRPFSDFLISKKKKKKKKKKEKRSLVYVFGKSLFHISLRLLAIIMHIVLKWGHTLTIISVEIMMYLKQVSHSLTINLTF